MKLFYEVTWDVNSFAVSGQWNPATTAWPFVLATGCVLASGITNAPVLILYWSRVIAIQLATVGTATSRMDGITQHSRTQLITV